MLDSTHASSDVDSAGLARKRKRIFPHMTEDDAQWNGIAMLAWTTGCSCVRMDAAPPGAHGTWRRGGCDRIRGARFAPSRSSR